MVSVLQDRAGTGTIPALLIVGDLSRLQRQGLEPPEVPGLIMADAGQIDQSLLERLAPDVVLSPLVAGRHDALDIARRLSEAGFAGSYRVVVGDLPSPAAVLAELREAAPGLDIDLVRLPPRG